MPNLIKLYCLNLLNEGSFSTLLSSKELLTCNESAAMEFLALSAELSKLDIRSKKRSVVQSNAT